MCKKIIVSDGTEFKTDNLWSCFIVHVHTAHVTIQINGYVVQIRFVFKAFLINETPQTS